MTSLHLELRHTVKHIWQFHLSLELQLLKTKWKLSWTIDECYTQQRAFFLWRTVDPCHVKPSAAWVNFLALAFQYSCLNKDAIEHHPMEPSIQVLTEVTVNSQNIYCRHVYQCKSSKVPRVGTYCVLVPNAHQGIHWQRGRSLSICSASVCTLQECTWPCPGGRGQSPPVHQLRWARAKQLQARDKRGWMTPSIVPRARAQ